MSAVAPPVPPVHLVDPFPQDTDTNMTHHEDTHIPVNSTTPEQDQTTEEPRQEPEHPQHEEQHEEEERHRREQQLLSQKRRPTVAVQQPVLKTARTDQCNDVKDEVLVEDAYLQQQEGVEGVARAVEGGVEQSTTNATGDMSVEEQQHPSTPLAETENTTAAAPPTVVNPLRKSKSFGDRLVLRTLADLISNSDPENISSPMSPTTNALAAAMSLSSLTSSDNSDNSDNAESTAPASSSSQIPESQSQPQQEGEDENMQSMDVETSNINADDRDDTDNIDNTEADSSPTRSEGTETSTVSATTTATLTNSTPVHLPFHEILWSVSSEKGYRNTTAFHRQPIHAELEDVYWPTEKDEPFERQDQHQEGKHPNVDALRPGSPSFLTSPIGDGITTPTLDDSSSSDTKFFPINNSLTLKSNTPLAESKTRVESKTHTASGALVFILADGHGGEAAAHFFVGRAKDSVPRVVDSRCWDFSSAADQSAFETEISALFKVLDAEYCALKVAEYRKWVDNGSPSGCRPVDDGCTFVVNVFLKGWMVNCNVGDSRTVVAAKVPRGGQYPPAPPTAATNGGEGVGEEEEETRERYPSPSPSPSPPPAQPSVGNTAASGRFSFSPSHPLQ
ncbi:hypothetical protein HK102_009260, partial [Quaeritorhiza haematococci]